MQRVRVILVLTAVLFTLAACSTGESDGGGGGSAGDAGGYGAPADSGAEEPAEGGAAAAASAVVASGNAFDPADLQLTAGETATITVENADSVLHSFTIDEAGVDQDVEGGQSASVEVAAPEAGTYTFYCKYHSGMQGSITVA